MFPCVFSVSEQNCYYYWITTFRSTVCVKPNMTELDVTLKSNCPRHSSVLYISWPFWWRFVQVTDNPVNCVGRGQKSCTLDYMLHCPLHGNFYIILAALPVVHLMTWRSMHWTQRGGNNANCCLPLGQMHGLHSLNRQFHFSCDKTKQFLLAAHVFTKRLTLHSTFYFEFVPSNSKNNKERQKDYYYLNTKCIHSEVIPTTLDFTT